MRCLTMQCTLSELQTRAMAEENADRFQRNPLLLTHWGQPGGVPAVLGGLSSRRTLPHLGLELAFSICDVSRLAGKN